MPRRCRRERPRCSPSTRRRDGEPMRSRSLLWSFNYAIEGIVYALRTQRNMRLHLVIAVLALIAAVVFRIERLELVMVLFAISLVFVAELANTAVEAAVDLATEVLDPLAKIAKDVAAGAVFVAAINAVVVGYLVFFGDLTRSTARVFTRVQTTPIHLTVIALALTALVVLGAKALTRGGTYLHGGWPSGHTALATATATAIGYVTGSPTITVLGLFLALLVAQSRVESEAHTVAQVVLGGVVGFLVTTLVFQGFPQLFRVLVR